MFVCGVWTYAYVYVSPQQEIDFGSSFIVFQIILLRQSCLMNLEICDYAKLIRQQDPGILLSLPTWN